MANAQMYTALFLAFLSNDAWPVRESADRMLTGRLTEPQCRGLLTECEDAEAASRLRIHLRRIVWQGLNALLPPDCPFWPDCDYTDWPKGEWDEGVEDWPACFRKPPRTIGVYPAFLPNREWTKECVFSFVLSGGDRDFAAMTLARAWKIEGTNVYRHETIRRALWWNNPGLLSDRVRRLPLAEALP